MKKSILLFSLLSGTALMLPNLAIASDINIHTKTHTPRPGLSFEFAKLDNTFKIASVCFLGVGDCDPNIGFGTGDDDYTIDPGEQCEAEGYFKNNCSSVQVPEAYCPYDKSYIRGCKCNPNLVSCPSGQVGVGESCDGKYVSCKCDPSLVACSSNQIGQGASCGGKYQSCVCKSEYMYTSSNCSYPRSLSGSSCDGKYTGCSCPTGVNPGTYGCEEYYPSPCSSVCKRTKSDNCDNRTAVSTPYGCMEYWEDCPSKCKTAYSDNCRNRTSVTCEYGCSSYFGDCKSKCQSCGSNPDCDVQDLTCEFGCASTNSCGKCTECKGNPDCEITELVCEYGCASTNSCGKCTSCGDNPDCDVQDLTCEYGCSSINTCGKCESCYPDNCRNIASNFVPSNATCTKYREDCPTACSAWECNSGYVKSGFLCVEKQKTCEDYGYSSVKPAGQGCIAKLVAELGKPCYTDQCITCPETVTCLGGCSLSVHNNMVSTYGCQSGCLKCATTGGTQTYDCGSQQMIVCSGTAYCCDPNYASCKYTTSNGSNTYMCSVAGMVSVGGGSLVVVPDGTLGGGLIKENGGSITINP